MSVSTRDRWSSTSLAESLRRYSRRSIAFDAALLGCRRIPGDMRRAFLIEKYRALARLLAGRPGEVRVGGLRFHVETISELGTLQSALIDVHDEIVVPGFLPTRHPWS